MKASCLGQGGAGPEVGVTQRLAEAPLTWGPLAPYVSPEVIKSSPGFKGAQFYSLDLDLDLDYIMKYSHNIL